MCISFFFSKQYLENPSNDNFLSYRNLGRRTNNRVFNPSIMFASFLQKTFHDNYSWLT